MNPVLRAAIAEAVEELANEKIEHIIILDLDGLELWRGKGTRKRVAHPDLGPNLVTIHNHPNGGWLSAQDVVTAFNCDEALMVVTTRDYVYMLERPFRGWTRLIPELYEQFENAGGEDMHRIMSNAARAHKFFYGRFRRASTGTTFVVGPNGAEITWERVIQEKRDNTLV